MDRQLLEDSKSRFVKYVEGLTSVIGHVDRVVPLHDYCAGLIAAEGRKSVEPPARRVFVAAFAVTRKRGGLSSRAY
jgi:SRSO17 transposase